jgi:hypothetical protein
MRVRVGADIFRRIFLKSPKQVLTCLNMCICKYIYKVNGACLFCTGVEPISVVGEEMLMLAIKSQQKDQNRKANVKSDHCR